MLFFRQSIRTWLRRRTGNRHCTFLPFLAPGTHVTRSLLLRLLSCDECVAMSSLHHELLLTSARPVCVRLHSVSSLWTPLVRISCRTLSPVQCRAPRSRVSQRQVLPLQLLPVSLPTHSDR